MAQLAVVLVYVARDLRRDKCLLFLVFLSGIGTISTLLTQLVLMRLSNVTASPSGYTNWLSLFVVLDNLAPAIISAMRDSKISFAFLEYLTGLRIFIVLIRQPVQLLP